MSFLSTPPSSPTSISGNNISARAFSALQAKYTDAASWALWAGNIVESNTGTNISDKFGNASINTVITNLNTAINNIPAYAAGTLDFTNATFSNNLLASLESSLTIALSTPSTGLGTATETAMFNAAKSRMEEERLAKFNEINTLYSSRGFDMPPGALLAKQTEMTSKTTNALLEVDSAILHESAVLASNYNIEMKRITVQLIQIISSLFDSKLMRDFEIKKVDLMNKIESYKVLLAREELKGSVLAQSAKLSTETIIRTLALEVEAMRGTAQSAAQMVSSALNGVNVSASIGFSGSESVGYSLSGTVGTAQTIPTLD